MPKLLIVVGAVLRGRGARAKLLAMTSKMHPDFKRGMTESRAAIADLQRRWPAAFPPDARNVRPLAGTIVAAIAAELGWNVPYCKGVIHVWKLRKAYCDAVLTYDLRRGLDGLPTEALVDAEARRMAQAQLAAVAASRQKREARKAVEEAKEAAAKVAAVCVDATRVSPPAPERRRPILTLASLRDGGHAAVG